MQSTQTCNATPVAYNQTACGPAQPRTLITIYDNGTCVSSYSCSYNPSNSYPPYYYPFTVQLGTTVMWFNQGTVDHTVTSSSTNNAGLQTFDSGPLAHYGSFSVTFNAPGNYSYYDMIHPVLRGNLIVSSTPAPVSSSFMPTMTLDGSVNWTVSGLDNNVAVLNVSHKVSIVASLGPISFTPATETGSFSQSIDLSTRVESAGTATSAILNIIQKMLSYYPPYYGYYGYPSALGQLLSTQKQVYTFWWVNGPLTSGQPVEILTGYASVIGSENVNLGPISAPRAWIVESELSQSISTTSPPVITSGGSSDASFKLDLRFDYDQASDLLLRSSTTVSVQSSSTQNYKPGAYLCGPSGCFPVSDPVTVSHHMSTTIPITLQLTSTNLDMSKRTHAGSTGTGQTSTGGPGGSEGVSILPPAMALWIYAGIGVVGVGIVATLAWLLRRRARVGAPMVQTGPPPDPSPAVARV
jgi:plastocyanin